MMNHDAIYKAYAGTVVRIDDSLGAFDANGNQVTLDQSVVDAAAVEVAAEQALAGLRSKRNSLLAETDYLALADHTLSAEMTAYRQALRDLPSNTTDPANPVWPTKPGG
jgi:homoaconitase/3-isopropylmalate dehydratase large subunit